MIQTIDRCDKGKLTDKNGILCIIILTKAMIFPLNLNDFTEYFQDMTSLNALSLH